jgi:hypothetical protein
MGNVMPLDSMGIPYNDFYRNRYLGAELKFAWLPKICNLTGKRIWLKKSYRLTLAMWTGPGDTIFEYKWHSKNAHIIWMLQR